MHFLSRFLKILVGGLLFAALGVLVFYWTVMRGSLITSGVAPGEYMQRIYAVLGSLAVFMVALSALLAFIGMKQSVSLPVSDRVGFVQKFQAAMAKVRYRPLMQTEDFLIFKPPIIGGLLAEKISLELKQDTAVLTAPRGLIGKIRSKL